MPPEKGVERGERGVQHLGRSSNAPQRTKFWSHLAELREKKKWSCSTYKEKTYGDLDYKQAEEEEQRYPF